MIKRIICTVLACAVPMTMSLPVLSAEQKGMLLHYSFNDMDNSGVVKDESGRGNDGKIYGDAVEEYGRIHFDGADDYIKLPDALLQNEDEVTIAINVCPEFDTLHYFTWNFGTSATEGYMFLNTSRPDAKLRFAITPASADKEQSLVSEEDIKKGTWSNVIVTIKGREGVMYRDGVKAAEATFDIAPRELGATTQNWIGRSPYGDALMQGYIDDFRIYNYALSEDEAKALSDEYEAELNDGITSALYESGIKNVIKEDITLPTEAAGAAIKWSSSNEAVISSDGKVTRPKEGEYAAGVTLTAEITKDTETQIKTFNVSVPPEGGGTYGLNITGERGADINPDMVGLFFEDINYAADGGLYAEMVENRSFEAMYADNKTFDPQYDGGWAWHEYPYGDSAKELVLKTDEPLNENNTHYLEFDASRGSFANAAYDGLALKKGMVYHGSFYAKTKDYTGNVRISAVKDGKTAASAEVEKLTDEWTKYSFDMTAAENVRGAELVVTLDGTGTVDFDMISLMPDDAVDWVFRRDLAEMLKAINPGFLRFPGGCVIEGYNLDNRYKWKDSIGPVEERKENWNRWDLHTDGYNHYNQTLGLGFYEYFKLCEYLECEAIPVVNVGMACQFQTNETVPIDSAELEQYIQDALDLIEFANGDVTTEYGAIRAEMGHSEPFNLTMLGIGNEQWNTEENQFRKRYEAFEKAIHEKYPDIKLIGTSGPDVNSAAWRGAWSWIKAKEAKNDNFVYAVDEHYYMTPEWFLQNTEFYDNYDRGTYVFAGEYASRTRNLPNDPEANTLYTALTEAAYFTGLERNS
ncbi:MAG: LamG-like jellyroll fold domain-containing protein, partial [Candidatus Ornithomonoglobus sp.]